MFFRNNKFYIMKFKALKHDVKILERSKGGMALIELKNVKKVYKTKDQNVEALKGINLKIDDGEIFGIIGYSGAGKSTLIRCMNLLEKPDSGTVSICGKELTTLSHAELRECRKKIGMIFQHFNLFSLRNVFQNVAYPLKGTNLSKKEIKEKVLSLLSLVGLTDKVSAYPSQLSGGQKQRVAIARALANDPEVLLCDEATSALDPETTASILELLKDINKKLNITIVIITHQMQVIKEICDRVAVMEDGRIVEEGKLLDIFAHPKADVTKKFIGTVFEMDKAYKILESKEFLKTFDEDSMLCRISFIGDKTNAAFISKISRDFGVDASILFGNIEIIQDVPVGNLVVKFTGDKKAMQNSIMYFENESIPVEVIYNAGNTKVVNA